MKIRGKFVATLAAGACALAVAGGAMGAVDFNSASGTGFVGKGDVQLALGLNNAGLQSGGFSFAYQATSVDVTETSWVCTNSNNEKLQERERATTESSSITGVVSSTARVKNQITGFNLLGYSGAPTMVNSVTTDGPPVNSCPAGPWTLTAPAGDPVEISSETTGGLYVNGTLLP